ncbi:hypothetical protein G3578_07410 [Brevibacillus sp. SYP-B805]|uniref:hypothetical protein n=1 Tax=Brevibacillus sp. SYP-B805 TaxID=1578199 RepID=UPI0013EA5A95|nr:hypothetical protein [Brevibacillus sp. SYP-B805]NGQ95012.1 hypothetical protein [Brevibacillus sp. SYP-B805]
MATRKDQISEAPEIKRTKQEWIESAAYLRAERFEVAGALFDMKDNQPVAESEVKQRLMKFKGGDKR